MVCESYTGSIHVYIKKSTNKMYPKSNKNPQIYSRSMLLFDTIHLCSAYLLYYFV